VVEFMDLYGITKEDRDAILELNEALGLDYASGIATRVKTAFTKAFNKDHYEFRKLGVHKKKRGKV